MRIENWCAVGHDDPYLPPEQQHIQIKGHVFGSRVFDDNELIHTSYIRSVDGVEVTTASGSVYTLGDPNAKYVAWCRENGHHVPTPDEPIKLKGIACDS